MIPGKMSRPGVLGRYLVVMICRLALVFVACLPLAGKIEWRRVTPEELKSAPVVDPGAAVEILFYHVLIREGVSWDYSVRYKIFTEKGAADFSTVKLPASITELKDVGVRVTQPDGTSAELPKVEIRDQVTKVGRLKVLVKSFAVPGLKPGSILDLHWLMPQAGLLQGARLDYQFDVPAREVSYLIKTKQHERAWLSYASFNCRPEIGSMTRTMRNVPAFREEENMPSRARASMYDLAYYDGLFQRNWWDQFNEMRWKHFAKYTEPTRPIQELAKRLIAGQEGNLNKVLALAAFCRENIKNVYNAGSGVTTEEREEFAKRKLQKPEETLALKVGIGKEINFLFGALARAAGFETRQLLLSEATGVDFDYRRADEGELTADEVGVEIDGRWRLFDPATRYVMPGMVRWQEEGQSGMMISAKGPHFMTTSGAPPDQTLMRNIGRFKLSEDGTLEGTVEEWHGGHAGASLKERYEDLSPAELENLVKEQVRGRIEGAEVTEINVENVTDLKKTLVIKYTLRVPGYGIRTAKRLILAPSVLARRRQPLFSSPTRTHPVQFNYSYTRWDDIAIELPEGLEFESLTGPANFQSDVGHLHLQYSLEKGKAHKLVVTRQFKWGTRGPLRVPVEYYGNLQKIFHTMHEIDDHVLTMRPPAAAATQ